MTDRRHADLHFSKLGECSEKGGSQEVLWFWSVAFIGKIQCKFGYLAIDRGVGSAIYLADGVRFF